MQRANGKTQASRLRMLADRGLPRSEAVMNVIRETRFPRLTVLCLKTASRWRRYWSDREAYRAFRRAVKMSERERDWHQRTALAYEMHQEAAGKLVQAGERDDKIVQAYQLGVMDTSDAVIRLQSRHPRKIVLTAVRWVVTIEAWLESLHRMTQSRRAKR